MATGRGEQFEDSESAIFHNEKKPWKQRKNRRKTEKKSKHKRERRRAKTNPDCSSEYRKYRGFEY